MNRKLIVNADDFARSPEIDKGVIESHLQGIVTTTTVLINMPGAVEAVKQARISAPDLGIGLHLNLTLGAPCSNLDAVPELTSKGGVFHPVPFWHAQEKYPLRAIETEWRAQIDRFLQTGFQPDHLDSHHHIAIFHKDFWELYLRLAAEIGCGVRPPFPADVTTEELGRLYPVALIEYASSGALESLKQSKVPHPTYFLASFFDEAAKFERLQRLLNHIPSGITELMCHPGHLSPSLKGTSSYNEQRAVELGVLTHPQTLALIRDLDIDLVTYQQAWPHD